MAGRSVCFSFKMAYTFDKPLWYALAGLFIVNMIIVCGCWIRYCHRKRNSTASDLHFIERATAGDGGVGECLFHLFVFPPLCPFLQNLKRRLKNDFLCTICFKAFVVNSFYFILQNFL